jgi:choline-sulfatase
MYPPEDIEMPETVGRWCEGQPPSLLVQSCGQMGLGQLREEYREGWSAYFGMVTMIDNCVGRIINALKEKDIYDNALIIFSSDHGELLGCHHLMQKHCCYEEASHHPAVHLARDHNSSTP